MTEQNKIVLVEQDDPRYEFDEGYDTDEIVDNILKEKAKETTLNELLDDIEESLRQEIRDDGKLREKLKLLYKRLVRDDREEPVDYNRTVYMLFTIPPQFMPQISDLAVILVCLSQMDNWRPNFASTKSSNKRYQGLLD